jgi:hypothetical protein
MQPDNRVQSNLGEQAEEFGRASEDSPGPTKQDSEQVLRGREDLGCLGKYDLLFTPHNIAIRCIGCMEYIWEHEYTSDPENSVTSLINDFTVAFLVRKVIEHHLECIFWNK